ncbi:Fatty acyl-CoA reductase 2, chloroplastic [Linum grandiflorum]
MLSKLVPVAGDLTQGSELGIDSRTASLVAGEVDLMVNSAANTTFDERYDVAINTNTKGAIHLMGFADKCKNLKLFLQVSTIYANGGRNGRVTEKPFINGETTLPTDNDVSLPSTVLDVAAEIELASTHHRSTGTNESDEMKNLGTQRAKRFGWHDTYTFTKAMGEMMIGECVRTSESKVPVVVVRPSIIESTYSDPFSGWIEGNRMLDPIAQSYCKGRMTSFPGDPNSIVDVVPVDMVVNVIIAAATRHAANTSVVNGQPSTTNVNVYHIGSSGSNPMTLTELFKFYYIHFRDSPILVEGRPLRLTGPLDICSSVQEFSSELRHAAGRISGEKMRQMAIRMATLYKPYMSFLGRYDCSNTEKLMREMSEEERANFGFDVTEIDWQRYIAEVHIPGLRKHVMKERMLAKVLI